ncbi:MAG: Flp family type IVb pilin [Actinomycetota bacterium]|nr:Flp family type IVb pilin [Actinomycetota bacterium]MDQ3865279.1 Flp family type IVb pilin [Actinomycetota bacterium]
MFQFFYALRNREEGQALVEYALILALVSVVAIGALEAIGGNVTTTLQGVADAL